jgi:hypothetical protein
VPEYIVSRPSQNVAAAGRRKDAGRLIDARRAVTCVWRATLAAVGACVLVGGALAGCTVPRPVGSALCPADLHTVQENASSEVTGLLDLAGTFDNASTGFLRQVDAIVATAVHSGSAFRIMTFSGAASDVDTLMLCRTTVPAADSGDAGAFARDEIFRILMQSAREKVAAVAPGQGGSNIWGAWAAYSRAEKLADDRLVIMLTDGEQTFRSRPPLDLSGVRTEMWNIGRLRNGGTVSSEQAEGWIAAWQQVLRDGGASDIMISMDEYHYHG